MCVCACVRVLCVVCVCVCVVVLCVCMCVYVVCVISVYKSEFRIWQGVLLSVWKLRGEVLRTIGSNHQHTFAGEYERPHAW